MRRLIRVALGGLAGCALILGASQAANGDSANATYLLEKVPTSDFQLDDPGPFDGAKGTLRVTQAPDDAATGFKLTVVDIEGAAGQEFGAHLHTGPCVNGDSTKAGPHYNHDVAAHGKTLPTAQLPFPPDPAEISPNTEVWFNLVPNDHDPGQATDDTKVQFVPNDLFTPGEMSIVIHALPTNTKFGIPTANQLAGYAGPRWACFGLSTPDWAPSP